MHAILWCGRKGGEAMGNLGTRKPRLVTLLTWRLFAVAALALAVLSGVWVASEIRVFDAAATRMREDMLEERRTLLRTVVGQAVEGIEYRRRQVDARVRSVLRERAGHAAAVAQSLWSIYADTLPRPEVEALIREALRALRYDGGRGYFFVLDRDIHNQLQPDRPEVEGRDMAAVRDADGRLVAAEMVAAADAEGGGAFYAYRWTRPDRQGPGHDHRKLAYIQHVEPLGWYIGTGEYLEDMERDIQRETAEWLSSIRYGADGTGYVFAADWSGLSVVGPGAGHNVLEAEDATGFKVVRALIDAARAGGGFVEYVQPSVPDADGYRTERKLSYVAPVADWHWYVGAGVYVDDVEREIAAARRALEDRIQRSLLQGVVLVALLAAATWWLSRRVARGVAGDVAAFERFFGRDGRHGEDLDPSAMQSEEFDHLAHAARSMARGRDTAELVLAERTRQLERSNEDLERFAWIASHDLQEPLRMVASFLQLLERRLGSRLDAEEAEYLAFAVQGARRMRLQIQALMAYARQQDEAAAVEPVRLAEVAEDVLGIFAADLASVGGAVEVADLPVVAGNRALLATILQNLISNAIKFREPDRPLRLRLTATTEEGGTGPAWRIAVSDNGSGLPRGYRGEAFQLLRRLHGPAVAGTGVGLAMVKKLVEAQGGAVGMDDGLDGHGLTVWFTLPAAEGGPEASAAGQSAAGWGLP